MVHRTENTSWVVNANTREIKREQKITISIENSKIEDHIAEFSEVITISSDQMNGNHSVDQR